MKNHNILFIFLGVLLGFVYFIHPAPLSASVVFEQNPTGDYSGTVLNTSHFVSFGCTAGVDCGLSGHTVYNIGVWIKKVGNPADIRLQVVSSFNDPIGSLSTSSNPLKANSISDTEYTLKWFYFPTGVVIGNQYDYNQFFQFQFVDSSGVYNPTDYYSVLYNLSNDYSALQQWCKTDYGCSSSAFFWKMDDSLKDLSITDPVFSDCCSNLLFLPGVMGSRLYEENGYVDCGGASTGSECLSDNELWVSKSDANHQKLYLDTSGKSINNIYTKDDTQNTGELDETGLVDDVYGSNIYQSFIRDLRDWKSVGLINDYAFVPYDWRLSLDDIVTNGATTTRGKLSYTGAQNIEESFLLKKLEELQKSSKTGKITLIGHSNGGLVIKALMQKLKDTNNPLYEKIDKIIFVAVPQVGTPEAVLSLLHGTDLGHGFIMDKERLRDLVENMPMIYNLIPSESYFSVIDPSVSADKILSFQNDPLFDKDRSLYGPFISDKSELRDYILGTDERVKPSFSDTVHSNIGNQTLYTKAQTLHQILDSWQAPTSTKVVQVAGWGEETFSGLDYVVKKNYKSQDTLSYKPHMTVDGDGTVVVPSALWMSTTNPGVERWWVDLSKFNKNNIFKEGHRNILEISNLRDFIKSKISNSSFVDPNNIVVNSNSTLLSSDTRLHYTLHSPLTLALVDSSGRYTGLDPVTGEVRQEIPNVTYRQIGDIQFLSIPSSEAFTLKMKGLSEGSFALDIEKQNGNLIEDNMSFQGVPSSTTTIVTMDILPNSLPKNSSLQIDQDGNGIVDKTLTATSSLDTILYDEESPELNVTFSTTTKDVIFSGVDNLDSNPTILTTSTSTTISDNQGNRTIIPFTKYRELPTRLKLSYNKIIRNGIIYNVQSTNILYDWQEKKGSLTDLDTKITVKGVERYVFNYRKSSNTTLVKGNKNNTKVSITKQGFVPVTIRTDKDDLIVSY
jgi:pimeloyl-ACP methyl ester carboxylesterase